MRPFFQLILVDDKWPHNPCLLIVPSWEESNYITPAFSGVPTKEDKVKSGYLNPCLLRALELGKMPKQPLRSRGPHKRGQNHKWLHNPCLLGGPQKRGQTQNWLCNPCLLGAQALGAMATRPLCSCGSPKKGTKYPPFGGHKIGQNGCNPCVLGVPQIEREKNGQRKTVGKMPLGVILKRFP